MNYYQITEEPIAIYGLAVVNEKKRQFWKLTEEIMNQMPQYDYLGKRATGGRVRFCTNAKEISIRMTLAQTKEDINIPLSGSAGADVYIGTGMDAKYVGYIAPDYHTTEEVKVEKTFLLGDELEKWLQNSEGEKQKRECVLDQMQLITINLPRNDHVYEMMIGIPEQAVIQKAPEYTYQEPIIFYGSSITEGGCASRAGNAYTSLVARWLDADYRNFGFSGKAKGELCFAEYITKLAYMSVLVMDYDHNAQSVEELQNTHEPFFQYIRERKPDLPILLMSRPDVDKDVEDAKKRRDIVKQTYEHAKQQGDKNIYFIDGFTLFGAHSRCECTVDGTHPNTLGFMRIAEKVYPQLKLILEKKG